MAKTRKGRSEAKRLIEVANRYEERIYKSTGHYPVKKIEYWTDKVIANYGEAIKIYRSLRDTKKINEIKEDILRLRKPSPSQKPRKPSRLERHLGFAIVAMISLVGALFFSVFSLTGSVVQGLNEDNSLWIGIVFFVVGLVFTFLYNRIKK